MSSQDPRSILPPPKQGNSSALREEEVRHEEMGQGGTQSAQQPQSFVPSPVTPKAPFNAPPPPEKAAGTSIGPNQKGVTGPGNIPTQNVQMAQRISTGPGESVLANSGVASIIAIASNAGTQQVRLQPGIGPRLVVLDTVVTGPGGGFTRGQVINLSHLLGDNRLRRSNAGNEAMDAKTDQDNARWASQALRRYVENNALREATPEEAEQDFVTFPEGLTAVTATMEQERNRRVAAELLTQQQAAEIEMLRQQLEGQNQLNQVEEPKEF